MESGASSFPARCATSLLLLVIAAAAIPFSTHITYANLLVPDGVTTRADILDAFRNRRTYCLDRQHRRRFLGGAVLQGGEMQASQSPAFQIHVRATEPILRLEIVRNNRIVFARAVDAAAGDPKVMDLAYRDNEGFDDTSMTATQEIQNWAAPESGIRPRPAGKTAYYYIRVTQRFSPEFPNREGEIAWSSPIYIRQ